MEEPADRNADDDEQAERDVPCVEEAESGPDSSEHGSRAAPACVAKHASPGREATAPPAPVVVPATEPVANAPAHDRLHASARWSGSILRGRRQGSQRLAAGNRCPETHGCAPWEASTAALQPRGCIRTGRHGFWVKRSMLKKEPGCFGASDQPSSDRVPHDGVDLLRRHGLPRPEQHHHHPIHPPLQRYQQEGRAVRERDERHHDLERKEVLVSPA